MITKITDFLKESIELNPLKWSDVNPLDIVEFIDEILYSKNTVNITEKIAGQHLTINIQRGFVTVSNKENSLDNVPGDSATRTKFGKPISTAIVELSKIKILPDITWRFELLHPKHNHDYIKYKNTDIIAIEYTGKLDKKTCDEINVLCKGGKVLCSEDIKAKFNNTSEMIAFKNVWENGLKDKISKLNPKNINRYYTSNLNQLKTEISNVIDKSLVSVIDGVTPIEGIVAKTKNAIFKLQTPNFLKLQKFQMTFFSIVKCKFDELNAIKANTNTTITDLRKSTGLPFKTVYYRNSDMSLSDVVKFYLEENSKIKDTDIDTNHYKKWLTKKESDDLLNRLSNGENVIKIYDEIVSLIKV